MNTWEKLWHRADAFTARDLLDLALVSRADPGAIVQIEHILEYRADALTRRLDSAIEALEEQYDALDILRPAPGFGDCMRIVRALLAPLRKTPRTEQRSAGYIVRPSRGRPLSRRLVDAVCA